MDNRRSFFGKLIGGILGLGVGKKLAAQRLPDPVNDYQATYKKYSLNDMPRSVSGYYATGSFPFSRYSGILSG